MLKNKSMILQESNIAEVYLLDCFRESSYKIIISVYFLEKKKYHSNFNLTYEGIYIYDYLESSLSIKEYIENIIIDNMNKVYNSKPLSLSQPLINESGKIIYELK